MIVTSSLGLRAFLLPHVLQLSAEHDLTVYAGDDRHAGGADLPGGVGFGVVPICREIRLFTDFRSLLRLYRVFRRGNFDLVYTLSPKAGLLGMMAAWLARVPCRVHCFTGQTWVTRIGVMRGLLKALDRLLARLATRTLADSASQGRFLVAQGVVPAHKIEVLGSGSMAGVDTQKFAPDADARLRLRAQLGIAESDCCVLFVGRLKRDKGVLDLAAAFARIRSQRDDVCLLLVGPDEERLLPDMASLPGLQHVDYTPRVAEYMAAADVFCLPSYREGFGQVVVEAGAVGLPVVASRIYGITDAVEEDRTGLLHEAGNVDELTACLRRLIDDAALRSALGRGGLEQARGRFSRAIATEALARFIRKQLEIVG